MKAPSFAPVLIREMRAVARRWPLYLQRIAAALVALVLIAVFWVKEQNQVDAAAMGKGLFVRVHAVMMFALWFIVPPVVAETLARERREGTLELLFLSPLSTRGIVVGKVAAGAMRALNLTLAVLPMMAMPLLLGGVSWPSILSAAVLELGSLIMAVGAGLMASRNARGRGNAVFLSYFYAFLYFYAFCLVVTVKPILSLCAIYNEDRSFHQVWLVISPVMTILLPQIISQGGLRLAPNFSQVWATGLILALPFALLCLGFTLWRTGRALERERNHQSTRLRKLEKRITDGPVLRALLRPNTPRRWLDFNPIFWLRFRSRWSALLPKAWLALFILVQGIAWYANGSTSLETYCFDDHLAVNLWAAILLLGIIAFINTSSFRAEKESGVLEMLLITPLSVRDLLWGGAFASWYQFRYEVAVLLISTWVMAVASALYYRGLAEELSLFGHLTLVFLTLYFALPFPSFYAGLRIKQAWRAILLAIVLGVILPLVLSVGITELGMTEYFVAGTAGRVTEPWLTDSSKGTICLMVTQVAMAALSWFLLRHSLFRRLVSW
jgi:ABC-type Na+ efflux pump permease subunit